MSVILSLISYIIHNLKIFFVLKLLNCLTVNTFFIIKLLIFFLLKVKKNKLRLLIILFCYSFNNSFKSFFSFAKKNISSTIKYYLFLEPFRRL
jgi:hypothetical protein